MVLKNLIPDSPRSWGKANKPRIEVVVQPVSWGSWPLVLSAEGLSLSQHTPFTRPAVRQAGVLGGAVDFTVSPSLCFSILEAKLLISLTSHPSFC